MIPEITHVNAKPLVNKKRCITGITNYQIRKKQKSLKLKFI